MLRKAQCLDGEGEVAKSKDIAIATQKAVVWYNIWHTHGMPAKEGIYMLAAFLQLLRAVQPCIKAVDPHGNRQHGRTRHYQTCILRALPPEKLYKA